MGKIRIIFFVCRLLGFTILKSSNSFNWETKNNQINLFLAKKKSLAKDQAPFPTLNIHYIRNLWQQVRKGYKHAFSSKRL